MKTKRRRGNRFLSLAVTVLFFCSAAVLYTSLGTFFSSCGPGPAKTINLTVKNAMWNTCNPPWYGDDVDLQQAFATGWRFQLDVLMGNTLYARYSFMTGTLPTGVTLVGNQMRGIQIPSEASFSFEFTMYSPCNCGAALQKGKYFLEVGVFNAGAAPTTLGMLPAIVFVGC